MILMVISQIATLNNYKVFDSFIVKIQGSWLPSGMAADFCGPTKGFRIYGTMWDQFLTTNFVNWCIYDLSMICIWSIYDLYVIYISFIYDISKI